MLIVNHFLIFGVVIIRSGAFTNLSTRAKTCVLTLQSTANHTTHTIATNARVHIHDT
jgi:hypothetical protein